MAIVYRDLDLNFIANPVTGDVSQNVGNLAVIRALENLVLTHHYESPFHPEIGTNTTKLLFENPSTSIAQSLSKEIKNAIQNFEPRVSVNYISVDADLDHNGYNVTISFFVNNQAQAITIATFLERLR